MSNPLIRLVFRSKSMLQPDDAEAFEALYRVMVKNNRRRRILGCIAQPDGHFVQVMEGKQLTVLPLFEKIKADTRHRDVVEIGRWEASAPLFESFAIARPDTTPLSEQSFRVMNDAASGAQVIALLLGLTRNPNRLYSTF